MLYSIHHTLEGLKGDLGSRLQLHQPPCKVKTTNVFFSCFHHFITSVYAWRMQSNSGCNAISMHKWTIQHRLKQHKYPCNSGSICGRTCANWIVIAGHGIFILLRLVYTEKQNFIKQQQILHGWLQKCVHDKLGEVNLEIHISTILSQDNQKHSQPSLIHRPSFYLFFEHAIFCLLKSHQKMHHG